MYPQQMQHPTRKKPLQLQEVGRRANPQRRQSRRKPLNRKRIY
jgi:hypothetical protein